MRKYGRCFNIVLIFLNYRICQRGRDVSIPETTTNTVGPTTTTEVRSGMNLCEPMMPLMKKQLSGFKDHSVEPSQSKNGYELNMVICEANEICQPFLPSGELAKIGYIFFFFKIHTS